MPLNFRLVLPKFPSLNRLWSVFGDFDLANYLKKASTYNKYGCMVKHFHGCLLLIMHRLHLPKIQAIFWLTLLPWYTAKKTDIQDEMEDKFETAHD